jgi:hypothetical protein
MKQEQINLEREAFEQWADRAEGAPGLSLATGRFGSHFVYADTASAFRAWLARAEQAQVVGWQPISTAPKDGTKFLGYRNGVMATSYVTPRDDCEMWTFGATSAAFEHRPEIRPTHWMPLPPPPEGEGKEPRHG